MTKGFLSVEEKLHSCSAIFSARFAESTVMLTVVEHYAALPDVPWQDGQSGLSARTTRWILPVHAVRRRKKISLLWNVGMSVRSTGAANLHFFAKVETSPPCAHHRAPGFSASGKVSVKQAPLPG